jgi:gliding motility-associated-like protein
MKTKHSILLILIFILSGFAFECKAQLVTDDIPLVPNVFTPNNDGVNDTFKVEFFEGSWKIMIFDRWGSLVYASEQGQGAKWNGYNLQGLKADEGVYFYTLKNESSGNSFNGRLHLFR